MLAAILSPLIGILTAFVAGENKTNVEANKISIGKNKKCLFCAELIKAEATVCRYCGKDLPEDDALKVKKNLSGELGVIRPLKRNIKC